MIDDNDLESALRQYRVRSPRPELRRRVAEAVQLRRPQEIGSFWGPLAAATILLVWVAIHTSRIEPERDPLRETEVAIVVDALGGGEDARHHAELVVPW